MKIRMVTLLSLMWPLLVSTAFGNPMDQNSKVMCIKGDLGQIKSVSDSHKCPQAMPYVQQESMNISLGAVVKPGDKVLVFLRSGNVPMLATVMDIANDRLMVNISELYLDKAQIWPFHSLENTMDMNSTIIRVGDSVKVNGGRVRGKVTEIAKDFTTTTSGFVCLSPGLFYDKKICWPSSAVTTEN